MTTSTKKSTDYKDYNTDTTLDTNTDDIRQRSGPTSLGAVTYAVPLLRKKKKVCPPTEVATPIDEQKLPCGVK